MGFLVKPMGVDFAKKKSSFRLFTFICHITDVILTIHLLMTGSLDCACILNQYFNPRTPFP
jgi:hypothetical protein